MTDKKRNIYSIELANRTLKDFEFIVGPMIGYNLSPPPYKPEAFIKGCFEGGATPIGSSRYLELEKNLRIVDEMAAGMEDRYYGLNLLCLWTKAKEFLDEFKKRGSRVSSFLDLNAIEMVMEEFLPLTRDIQVPIFMGIHYPPSLSFLKKLLLKPEHAHVVDRIAAGNLTIYVPGNVGGGHLPAITRDQMEKNGVDEMIVELLSLEKAIGYPVPFVVEKGLMNVDDFVEVITKYSQFPSFKGVRFASNLLLSREITMNPKLRALLTQIVMEKRSDMIIPVRSQLGAVRKDDKVRGGVLMWVVATELMQKLHANQCDGADFPKMRRPYKKELLELQAELTNAHMKKQCKLCHANCPQEICGNQISWHSLEAEGLLEQSSVTLSPKIVDIDRAYIDAPAEFIVKDLIAKVIAKLEQKQS